MLITLKHLLVLLGLLFVSLLAGAAVAEVAGLDESMGFIVLAGSALLVPALLSWPVFRLLAPRPLILPLCPHCGKRAGNYHVPREAWPDCVTACGHCGKPLRLILSTRTGPIPPSGPPVLTLRRPGFLGLWKRGS